MDEVHAEVGGDHAEGRADLRAVADEDELAVLKPLAGGEVFDDGAEVADLLRRVVVVGHAVEHRNGAGAGELDDGLVLDDAGHEDVGQAGEDPAGVADRLPR